MIKKIILLLIITISFSSLAQVNLQETFKMQLFLNKKSSIEIINSDFKAFSEAIVLKIDSLEVKNSLLGSLHDKFTFYKADVADIKPISQKSKPFDVSCYEGSYYYILAINNRTGMSYRLAGFETNDFISFYNDFASLYNGINANKLKIRDFLKNFKVENLDFKCLHDALTSSNIIDRNKYPCLKKCEDFFKIGNSSNQSQ